MTFLSRILLSAVPAKNIIRLTLTLSVLFSSIFLSSSTLANSCSKSDIDYYLQRGFSNAQVVQLCSGASQNNGQQTQNYQAPAAAVPNQQTQQQNQVRQDESYLSAALDADGISMTNQSLTLLPRECVDFGGASGVAGTDLVETICVNTKLKINFSGMTIGKVSKALYFVRSAKVKIKGNIQREFVGINQLRRQDKEAILGALKTNPQQIELKIRKGVDPTTVANRLRKYSR